MRGARRIVLGLLLAVLGMFALDALLFRTHLYPSILEPNSSSGILEQIFRRERLAQKKAADNLVVTVGNSRMGFLPRIIDHSPTPKGYEFRAAGAAGTNARVWYYVLRDLDPTARRYRALVIGLDDYDDEDEAYHPDDDITTLHYAIARLRLTDALEFARSFHDPKLQRQVFRGAILKGIIYQTDIEAFLTHPIRRIAFVRLCNEGFAQWTYDFVETDRTMAGLEIDWSTLKATIPPWFNKDQRDTVGVLTRAPWPQDGRLAAYRRKWFGKIIDYYKGSRTKVIFLRLARGPLVRPANLVHKLSSSIREFAARPNVYLIDEHAFDSLEHPEFFKDAIHLNRDGVARFSAMLADEVARILGPPGERAAR